MEPVVGSAATTDTAMPPRCDDTVAPQRCWRVLHTRSRQEKAVAQLLEAAGVEQYLPLVRRTRVWGGKRRTVFTPLFPGYVFVRALPEETYVAVDSGRVVQRLDPPDPATLAWELAQLRRALEQERSFDPYPYLREGRRVRVRSGPLQGLEGLIDARRRVDRLVLQVQALGRATSLEIDADLLEPLE
ncbi:MAG: hypothetical protein D6824_02725 [Planctomycetota bacterium]|nr:MAG: hypothetical protein D6824_02725 [Planctomycetota bacterium]